MPEYTRSLKMFIFIIDMNFDAKVNLGITTI